MPARTLLSAFGSYSIRCRQEIGPVYESGQKGCAQRQQHAPAVVLNEHAPDAGCSNAASGVGQSDDDGQDRLHAKVGGEDGPLQNRKLGSREHSEGSRGIDEALRAHTSLLEPGFR